jgi:hypothetical protein
MHLLVKRILMRSNNFDTNINVKKTSE